MYNEGDNWAILACGSSGYINYRHQADVFHVYQSLIKRGFSKKPVKMTKIEISRPSTEYRHVLCRMSKSHILCKSVPHVLTAYVPLLGKENHFFPACKIVCSKLHCLELRRTGRASVSIATRLF